MSDSAPARYFPIRDTPLRMEAGLQAFGADFGNGAADRQFFPFDRKTESYRKAKREVPAGRFGLRSTNAAQQRAHRRVLEWINAQLVREHPRQSLPDISCDDPRRAYESIAGFVPEDLAVLCQDEERPNESAIAVYVAFPSAWRPERILGASFARIHQPVPGFADHPLQSASMVASMVERGPYVRFVWTLCADDHLDHHPEEGRQLPWRMEGAGWLRVERQISVPFPSERASLFLIRTHLYPFADLTRAQRKTLLRALETMPAEIVKYKGLDGSAGVIARRLLMEE